MGVLQKANITALVEKIANAKVAKKSSKAGRIAQWKEITPEKQLELEDTALSLVGYFGLVNPDKPRELDSGELYLLAEELKRAKQLSEATASINERIKDAIFNHLESLGLKDASIPIPEVGFKFERRASGVGNPSVNWNLIIDLLTEEERAELVTAKTVVTYEIDKEKLALKAALDPEFEDRISQAITPGEERWGSFYFTELKEEK